MRVVGNRNVSAGDCPEDTLRTIFYIFATEPFIAFRITTTIPLSSFHPLTFYFSSSMCLEKFSSINISEKLKHSLWVSHAMAWHFFDGAICIFRSWSFLSQVSFTTCLSFKDMDIRAFIHRTNFCFCHTTRFLSGTFHNFPSISQSLHGCYRSSPLDNKDALWKQRCTLYSLSGPVRSGMKLSTAISVLRAPKRAYNEPITPLDVDYTQQHPVC